MEENRLEPDPSNPKSEEGPEYSSNNKNLYIVGINLAVLAVYTLMLRFVDDGAFIDAFLLLLHFLVCLIMSIVKKNGTWVLAAFLVLIIGFSTCVYLIPALKI